MQRPGKKKNFSFHLLFSSPSQRCGIHKKKTIITLRCGLDTSLCFTFCANARFTLWFFWHAFSSAKLKVRLLFMNSSRIIWLFNSFSATSVGPVHCSRDLQISLFINFFIKNGSHGSIHTFKNYFTTVFSVFSKISSIQTDLSPLLNSCLH